MRWLALFGLVVVGPDAVRGDLPDPTAVPAEGRIAALNALFESREGAETDRHYQSAICHSVAFWNRDALRLAGLDERVAPDATAAEWIDANEDVLHVRFDWPAERVAHIDRWLGVNASALSALRQAVAGARWYRPFAAESGRLADIDLIGDASGLRALARLQALSAARLAYAGRWDDAVDAIAGNLVLFTHVRQRPLVLWQALAGLHQDIALSQLSALLPHLGPDVLKRLQTSVGAALGAPGPSDEQIAFAELLYSWDTIERYHEWARDERRHPSVRAQLSTFLTMHTTLRDEGLEKVGLTVTQPSIKSVDAVKAELLKTTPQATWKVVMEREAVYVQWAARPLPEALTKRAAFDVCSREIGRKDPLTCLFDETSIFRPGHFRLLRAKREARRAGFDVLLAMHRFKAERNVWPARLDALLPDFLSYMPIDPYSDQPLVYRRNADGDDFVLYSIGENQQDDGGRASADDALTDASPTGDIVFWPLEVPQFK